MIDNSHVKHIEIEQLAIYLAKKLVSYPSITPDDAGSFDFLYNYLTSLGFNCREVTQQGVRNLIATQYFGEGETFAFAGHLDVVPTGPEHLWRCSPFSGEIIDECLYGRGIADMKGAIACFIAAIESLLTRCSRGTLMLLITCDEEGEAEYGTASLMQYLRSKEPEKIPDYCLVGEPSCKTTLGDTIKIGRRGALSGHIRVLGRQGHVAYPDNCENAAHYAVTIADKLLTINWDKGTKQMPGTSLQITQLSSGEFVDNIVPGITDIHFNIRYSSLYSEQHLKTIIDETLQLPHINIEIDWQRPCEPYFNSATDFVGIVSRAILKTVGIIPMLTTDGGTSDGRFIASDKTQVIEFGVKNETIHQVNEHVPLTDLYNLTQIYQVTIAAFCCQDSNHTSTINKKNISRNLQDIENASQQLDEVLECIEYS
ncbi:succinyl-diaminopimelate desuccinylase [Colwellia psychrerythraea]|uniref:Succinyl-diaminopimelate desuccinylase n=1 Tax=Colwellia psychrerythraea TaxID=28229 RepID=A0A099L3U3_COLPS|nr:succinyl-diaminopimelate desuccinylase [Colwellia psychrerythraea]KGJ97536.1 Succinyl-diaminopimelate desuccinylase [Colwellia psychrerythraea]